MEPAGVAGVILDSSVIIAAERSGQTVRQILEQVRASQGEIEIGLSVVTIAELVHGAYRAGTEARRKRRLEFIDRARRRLSRSISPHVARIDEAFFGRRSQSGQRPGHMQAASRGLCAAVAVIDQPKILPPPVPSNSVIRLPRQAGV